MAQYAARSHSWSCDGCSAQRICQPINHRDVQTHPESRPARGVLWLCSKGTLHAGLLTWLGEPSGCCWCRRNSSVAFSSSWAATCSCRRASWASYSSTRVSVSACTPAHTHMKGAQAWEGVANSVLRHSCTLPTRPRLHVSVLHPDSQPHSTWQYRRQVPQHLSKHQDKSC